MKVSCPRCKRPIELGYLKSKGNQMACCSECRTVVAATYKKDSDRIYWEFKFEKALPKKPYGGGCGTAILIIIVLSLLAAIKCCSWKVPYEPPGGATGEQLKNRYRRTWAK